MSYEPIKRILALCGLILVTLIFAAFGVRNATSEGSARSRFDTIDDLGWSLAYEYRVQISPKFPQDREGLGHVPIIAKQASLGECEKTLKLLKSELALYPRAFLRKILPRQIIICRDLIHDDVECGGITDFTHDSLFLNCIDFDVTESVRWQAIHHEIYHVIDHRDDVSRRDDKNWAALNPSSFRYAEGNERNWIDFPGFLSDYATTSVAEDKAELFSFVMTNPDSVRIRAETDVVLRRKLEYLGKSIASQCPELSAKYLARVLRSSAHEETISEVHK